MNFLSFFEKFYREFFDREPVQTSVIQAITSQAPIIAPAAQNSPTSPPNPSEPTPPPPPPKTDMLTRFCIAIRDYEGKPSDRNYRNNNPGNCRYSSVGYASFYGKVGKDKDNFAIFKDYATGFLYLKNLVRSRIKQHPDWTISDFFYSYAPPTDGNNTPLYALSVAKRLSVDVSYQIKNLTS